MMVKNRATMEPRRGLREKLKKLLSFGRRLSPSSRSKEMEDFLKSGETYVSKPGSVYEEGKVMLILSDMVYSFSALRKYATQTNDIELQKKLQVPQISSTLTPAIVDNLHLLKRGESFNSGFMERAIQTINGEEFVSNSKENSEVIVFGDSREDYRNSCVYGIGVNRSAKRITVWFRGTVMQEEDGMKHWEKNFDTTLRIEENPIDEMLDSTPTFHLHRGFVRSLLGRRRQIILQILKYQEDHPETRDYPIYVSGHSLGGALATLFGFYACQDPALTRNGPVRVYTFAAPPVGDGDFLKIFRHLEECGKIRLARIHNVDDPVPSAFALTKYTHVGLGIVLSFPGYEIVEEDRSSLLKGFNADEHRQSKIYSYLNRHSVGFNSTLEEMYRDQRGI